MLEVRDIRFSYGNHTVLDGVTFAVADGEVVGLLGRNGAGKTTLLQILATCQLPDGGSISLDGIDPLATPLRYCHRLGYLPEKNEAYGEMSVKERLLFRAKLKGERGLRIRRRVTDLMKTCDIEALARRRIETLSPGCRKCVGLADALLRRPPLLLLDDLFAGVDAARAEQIVSIFKNPATRCAALVSGHDVRNLARICSRFLVLDNGTIAHDISIPREPDASCIAQIEALLK